MKRFVTTTVEIEGREEIAVVEVPTFERARYTHDVRLPGMRHARLVRAAIPAGRVTRLDRSRSRDAVQPARVRHGVQAAELPVTPAGVLEASATVSPDTR